MGVSCAQSAATETIVGKVVDPQGAIILDAKVTAVNSATGVSRSVNKGEHDLKWRLCDPQPSSWNV